MLNDGGQEEGNSSPSPIPVIVLAEEEDGGDDFDITSMARDDDAHGGNW